MFKDSSIYMLKRFFILLLIACSSFVCNAQTPIKFLGIPVDGSKTNMIAQLTAQGFRYDSLHDCLEGLFNGKESNIMIHENNGVVDRVMVWYPVPTSMAKSAFNSLLRQFRTSDKYVSEDANPIPDTENAPYELHNGKMYSAVFFPDPFVEDGDKELQDYIANTTAKQVIEIVRAGELENPTEDRVEALSNIISTRLIIDNATSAVWFRLVASPSEADCLMYIYYDNLLNQTQQNDL